MPLFIYFIPYLLIGAINLYGCYYDKQNVVYFSKPSIVLYLYIIYLYFSTKENIIIMFGIILSLTGDIYLMFGEIFWEGVFIFWLSDFVYVIALFTLIRKQNYLHTYKVIGVLYVVYILLFILIPYRYLYPSLADLKIMVFIYGLTLCSTNLFATAFLILDGFNIRNCILFVGTVFYMISDFLLVHGMMVSRINNEIFFIMITYIIAQGCIIYSLLSKETQKY